MWPHLLKPSVGVGLQQEVPEQRLGGVVGPIERQPGLPDAAAVVGHEAQAAVTAGVGEPRGLPQAGQASCLEGSQSRQRSFSGKNINISDLSQEFFPYL